MRVEKEKLFLLEKVMIMSEGLYNELLKAYTKETFVSMIRADIEQYQNEKYI